MAVQHFAAFRAIESGGVWLVEGIIVALEWLAEGQRQCAHDGQPRSCRGSAGWAQLAMVTSGTQRGHINARIGRLGRYHACICMKEIS